MKNTIQIIIGTESEQIREELIARLSVADFDGFEENDKQLIAYISEENFEPNVLSELLSLYGLGYEQSLIEEQNWNALWESNFQPVIVDNFCAVRAEFHEPVCNVQHELIITPKMSFGTGHHATTYMMINEMSKLDFKGKEVADFGTGTGILAILAEKLGSNQIWAIDNDDWSIENATENIERNACKNIRLEKADSFESMNTFDLILANINKSILTANRDGLFFGLRKGGYMLLSGLLKEDEADILPAFKEKSLKHVFTREKNQWICLLLQHE